VFERMATEYPDIYTRIFDKSLSYFVTLGNYNFREAPWWKTGRGYWKMPPHLEKIYLALPKRNI